MALAIVMMQVAVVPSIAQADYPLILKLADTQTPIPGGQGNFVGFGLPGTSHAYGDAPHDHAMFVGYGVDGQVGIFHGGSSFLVAGINHNTVITGFGSGVTEITDPVQGAGSFADHLAFTIRRAPGDEAVLANGQVILRTGALRPDGNTYLGFGEPWVSSQGVVLVRDVRDGALIFRWGNETYLSNPIGLTYAHPNGTPANDTITSTGSRPVFLDNQLSIPVFRATTAAGHQVILSGELRAIVDHTTPIPGGVGTFTDFGEPVSSLSYGGSTIGYVGYGVDGQQGIYLGTGTRLVDLHTPIPGGVGNFTGFGEIAIDDGIVFIGHGANSVGIYTTALGPSLQEFLAAGDVFDGKIVSDVAISRAGFTHEPLMAFHNRILTFRASFTDGSQGVYLVVLPEPSAACLVIPFALLTRRVRRVALRSLVTWRL